jgi:hypothetical protein
LPDLKENVAATTGRTPLFLYDGHSRQEGVKQFVAASPVLRHIVAKSLTDSAKDCLTIGALTTALQGH